MIMPAAGDPAPKQQIERRDFQRVNVTVYGRYMLQDRSEHACQVVEMSPGNAALIAECPGRVGERVIAYLDHLGRIEGRITRVLDNGFAMTVSASERKRDRLAAQLTWLANKHELDLPEDRRHNRITPRNPVSTLQLPDGSEKTCRVVDLSLSGAAVETEAKPRPGTQVLLAGLSARVIRQFEGGVALEFSTIQEQDTLLARFDT